MRVLALVLQCFSIFFALYLCYQVGLAFLSGKYDLMGVVADIGTILVCIDLAVFIWFSRRSQANNLQEYANTLDQPAPMFVKVCRKVGHFGILLIICSWIVPAINA